MKHSRKPSRAVVPVIVAVLAVLAVGVSAAPASADRQPANLGNVDNVDRGNSAPGPHCHYNDNGGGMSGFQIITGAAHQGHINTTGVFTATACP